jgi:DNA-binding phage protein
MSFPTKLRPLVDRVGGSTEAAAICGVTRQTVNLWLRGGGNPSTATQAGAILLLSKAPKKHATA